MRLGDASARSTTQRRLLPLLAAAVLAAAVALTIGAEKANAAVLFDGSPGTGAPPATLGGYTMTPFAADPQPLFTNVSGVAAPTGTLGFSPSLSHRKVGNGWLTWSHGYAGDVYTTTGTTATLTLPANTVAFYFYVEPNIQSSSNVTATANGGATSGPVSVNGNSGASYFGFYATGSDTLTSVTINVPSPALGFAVGEFGIAYRKVNKAPDCSKVKADKTILWPPDHKLVPITLSGLTDPDGDPTTLMITGVTQDEPVDGLGDGDTSPDAVLGPQSNQVKIRAERAARDIGGDAGPDNAEPENKGKKLADGRVYEISYKGADDQGGSCSGTVHVGVPFIPWKAPIDSGQKYNSLAPAPNRAPDCSDVRADRKLLWPANHTLVTVSLFGLRDPDGDPTTLTIMGVTQDEPLSGLGNGDQSPDAAASNAPNRVQLRAERNPLGNGRAYAIKFTGTDDQGASCTGTERVGVQVVPWLPPFDSGQKYNSFGS